MMQLPTLSCKQKKVLSELYMLAANAQPVQIRLLAELFFFIQVFITENPYCYIVSAVQINVTI